MLPPLPHSQVFHVHACSLHQLLSGLLRCRTDCRAATLQMLTEAGVANHFHRQQLIEYAIQLEGQIASNRRRAMAYEADASTDGER